MHACEREERTSGLVYQIKKMFLFLFFYIRVIGRKGEIVLFPLFFFCILTARKFIRFLLLNEKGM